MNLWGKIVLGNYDKKDKIGGHHSHINKTKFQKGIEGQKICKMNC